MNKAKFLIVTSLVLIALVYSCTKDNLPEENPLTKLEILVRQPWQVDEVMSNVGCKNLHFVRGEINNTGVDYSNFRLTFKVDGTGTYTNETGVTYTTTWEFTSADQHNMKLLVNSSTPQIFIWNMVEISKTSFQSITALDKLSILQSTRYVPVP
ncbi:hypothetical protein [Agriterribacter sp.]|uniref:hypothetical protein n=1 Tax=Agriterribacter sp. TaxID=2821509 RepID=UPI002B57F8D1|nr:hypothetical protein [Agriterribacter sp.]HTN07639.1 hypothetical protein [Agriterribacter sp.]